MFVKLYTVYSTLKPNLINMAPPLPLPMMKNAQNLNIRSQPTTYNNGLINKKVNLKGVKIGKDAKELTRK